MIEVTGSPISFQHSFNDSLCNEPDGMLGLSLTGGGPLPWSVTGQPTWLFVSPSSGDTPDTLHWAFNCANAPLPPGPLGPGDFPISLDGEIVIAVPGASNSPFTVPVDGEIVWSFP